MSELDMFNNRAGTLNETDGVNCDICKNKGWVYYHKEENKGTIYEDEIYVKDCQCKVKRNIIENITKSGLLEAFKTQTFNSYEAKEKWQIEAKKLAMEYTKTTDNEWFLYSGFTGCGKTHLATAISFEFIKKGYSYHYMKFSSEIVKLTKDMQNFNESIKANAERDFNKLLNVDVLYIDDFLKLNERDKDSIYETLFTLINHRYINKKRTIITTEYSKKDIMAYDGATGGRILERARGFSIDIPKVSGEELVKMNYRMNW